jgi:hypothetical protein
LNISANFFNINVMYTSFLNRFYKHKFYFYFFPPCNIYYSTTPIIEDNFTIKHFHYFSALILLYPLTLVSHF